MLSYLADYDHIIGPLRLFKYITLRCAFAASASFFIGYLLGPWLFTRLRRLKLGQVFRNKDEVRELADLHAGKKDTPTMGGLLIYVSVTLSALLFAELNIYVCTALIVYTILMLVGFFDDYLKIVNKSSGGLPGRVKLLIQAILTVLVMVILLTDGDASYYMQQLWVPFYKESAMDQMPLWFMFILLFLIIAGSSNAINLTDGVDGLAIGCTVTTALAYAIMAYLAGHAVIADYLFISHIPGSGELAVVCSAMIGASLAFLWYNCHPAEVFMGDTGSLSLGGLVGIIAFMVHQPLTLVIVGGIFVMEAMSVILQVGSYKLRNKKRIFLMAPIHHHFELKGWQETKVVIRFWIISLIFALAGLATLKLR